MENKGKKKPLRITESKKKKKVIIVLIDHLNSILTSVKGT